MIDVNILIIKDVDGVDVVCNLYVVCYHDGY